MFARFGVSAQLSFRAQQTRGSLITHSSRSFIRLDEHGFPVHEGNSRTVISQGCPPCEHVGTTSNRTRFCDNNIEAELEGTADFVARVPPFPTIRFFSDARRPIILRLYNRVSVDLIATLVTVLRPATLDRKTADLYEFRAGRTPLNRSLMLFHGQD